MTEQIMPAEITLDNLREGKISVVEIPRSERLKLELEERERLSEENKEDWEAGMKKAWEEGWKPKHLLIGKRKDGTEIPYKDWKEFLEVGEKIIPVQNERLRNQNEVKDKEIAQLKRDIARMSELQRMQAERALKKDKAEVESQLREFSEVGISGDEIHKFNSIQARKAEIEQEEKILKEYEPQSYSMPHLDRVQVEAEKIAFKARNPWFDSDRIMQRYAIGVDAQIRAENPNLTPAEHFALVEDEVKREFADKFKSQTNSLPQAVESARSSGNLINPKANYITFDQLPESERTRAEQMIRLKIGGYKSKADFMEKYNKINKK